MGYNNYWKVLNAKNYEIPQNCERVFIISIRKDIDNNKFTFPDPIVLNLKLKDILEERVDEKYYLTDKGIGRLIKKNNRLLKDCQNLNVSSCIIAGYHKMSGKYIADTNNVERITGLFDTEKSKHEAGSVYNPNGLSLTLTAMNNGGHKQPSIQDRIYDTEGIATTVTASQFGPNIAEKRMFNPYIKKKLKIFLKLNLQEFQIHNSISRLEIALL